MSHAFVHRLGLAGQPHRANRVAAATPRAKHPHAPAEVMPPARRSTSAARDTVLGAANSGDVEPAIAVAGGDVKLPPASPSSPGLPPVDPQAGSQRARQPEVPEPILAFVRALAAWHVHRELGGKRREGARTSDFA